MITATALDNTPVSATGLRSARIEAPTRGKDQVMVYIACANNSGTAVYRLSMEMADPNVMGGAPFQMCQLEAGRAVPIQILVDRTGSFRVPVPVGANETRVFVKAELLEGDPQLDKLDVTVTTASFQAVSGLYN